MFSVAVGGLGFGVVVGLGASVNTQKRNMYNYVKYCFLSFKEVIYVKLYDHRPPLIMVTHLIWGGLGSGDNHGFFKNFLNCMGHHPHLILA